MRLKKKVVAIILCIFLVNACSGSIGSEYRHLVSYPEIDLSARVETFNGTLSVAIGNVVFERGPMAQVKVSIQLVFENVSDRDFYIVRPTFAGATGNIYVELGSPQSSTGPDSLLATSILGKRWEYEDFLLLKAGDEFLTTIEVIQSSETFHGLNTIEISMLYVNLNTGVYVLPFEWMTDDQLVESTTGNTIAQEDYDGWFERNLKVDDLNAWVGSLLVEEVVEIEYR